MRPALLPLALLPAAASAQSLAPAPVVRVAVHVSAPIPRKVPREVIEAGMAKSAPTYATVPGLVRGIFAIGPVWHGGVYLFRDRAPARAWFTDAWRAEAATTYGAQPVATYFDVPLIVNAAAK